MTDARASRRSIDDLLVAARAQLGRVKPTSLAAEIESGAVIVDIRPVEQRAGAIIRWRRHRGSVVNRTVDESGVWRTAGLVEHNSHTARSPPQLPCRAMDGYNARSYGEAFADVYDEWYTGISDVDATIVDLLALAGDGPVLELGVGTGRLAVPLAEAGRTAGITVTGVDASAAMLAKLAERDTGRLVTAIEGDMIADLPTGPFALAFVAYNTIFNLTAEGAQAACFSAVAERLAPGGRFVIECFVPDHPPRQGDDVSIRTLAADRVVLSITRHEPDQQMAAGQFVELNEAEGVRLRPWSIRYATPSQLDTRAAAAGFVLEHRWEAFGGAAFDDTSTRHVSVYRLAGAP